jgi:VanZ family protein
MSPESRLRWIRFGGVIGLGVIIFASVFLPTKWEQLRSGHWAIEHFIAYFAAALIFYAGWGRPLAVALAFVVAAALLEGLQSLTPNHTPNLLSAFSGMAGAVAGVALAWLIMQMWRVSAEQKSSRDARVHTDGGEARQ